ncbi:M48 family metalloprotease [Candidatus Woesearchaeota archaeon]|nr:M48 family metalloprotease [Candidatus Woesearchaeota archaeon]
MEVLFSSPTCFSASTILGVDKIAIAIFSLSIAVLLLLLLRRGFSTKSKIFLIYGHLAFLFFPFVLLAANTGCGTLSMSCHNNYQQLIAYALPGTLAASALAGLFVIPAFYTLSSRREIKSSHVRNFVRRHSTTMNIKTPKLYVIDKAKPMAFSFRSLRSAIFLSAGIFDVLTKKEIEAILLHEIAHIKHHSSVIKVSTAIARIFSPLTLIVRFHDASGIEEEKADKFAIKTQGTSRHIRNAKRKVEAFD